MTQVCQPRMQLVEHLDAQLACDAAFEIFDSDHHVARRFFIRSKGGDYVRPGMRMAWLAWQARPLADATEGKR